MIKRFHLFELEDLKWFPNIVRRGITDYLQFVANKFNVYQPILPIIINGLKVTSNNTIIDLASGGSGGIKKISRQLKVLQIDHKIILTDIYPNIPAYKKIHNQNRNISYESKPVNVLEDIPRLNGFLTMFVAFHHFTPKETRKIIEDAVNNKLPIGIFELTERNFVQLLSMFFTPLAVMMAVPFIKPLNFGRLFFTYCIPLIPIATTWDGIVSVLRSYNVSELQLLISDFDDQYEWEVGKVKSFGPLYITYVFGKPKDTLSV